MRQAIETAPKDGQFVILEDDAGGTYAIGRWSRGADNWVADDDLSIKLAPTHWLPLAEDANRPPGNEDAENVDHGRASVWRVVLPCAAVTIAILATYLQRDGIRPPAGTAGDSILARGAVWAGPALKPASLMGRDSEVDSEPARAAEVGSAAVPAQLADLSPSGATPEAKEQGTAKAPGLAEAPSTVDRLEAEMRARNELEKRLDDERGRSVAVASHLATARREVQSLTSQLQQANHVAEQLKQEGTTKNDQLLEQRRQNEAARADAMAARQELIASARLHAQELEKEQARSAALVAELAMARHDIEIQAAQLRQAIEETTRREQLESARAEQLVDQQQQISAARAETVAARTELASNNGQHAQALDDERARSAALATELGLARNEIAAQKEQLGRWTEAALSEHLRSAKPEQSIASDRESKAAALARAAVALQELSASNAQQSRALEEERARSAEFASEVEAARREIETLTAQSRQANEEAALLRRGLNEKTEQIMGFDRENRAALAEAAAARQERSASTEQYRRYLDDERGRNAGLAAELETARQLNERLAAQSGLAKAEAEVRRQSEEARIAVLQQALKDEREKVVAGAAKLDDLRRATAVRLRPEQAASWISSIFVPAEDPTILSSASPEAEGGAEASRMILRGGALLGQGDIGAARIVLERAAELGSSRAMFMLAETYDPSILLAWKTYGTRGEVTKARELYARAHAGGIREAKARFDTLNR